MRKLLLFIVVLACAIASAQTFHYPALETPNVFTNTNEFLIGMQPGPTDWASLQLLVPPPGTMIFCSNCTLPSNPCSIGGTGTMATYINGGWNCNYGANSAGGGGSVTLVNTTAPLVGGPISVTGSISCPTCVVGATTNGGLVDAGTTLGLIATCSTSQILQWTGTAWACAATTPASIKYATSFSGADIFAQANAAAASFAGASGVVIIPPGTYTATTTLLGVSGITFVASGVTVTWTPTSGNAVKFSSIQGSALLGPMTVLGAGSGTPVGLYLGNSVANQGQTLYNVFRDLHFGANPQTSTCSTGGFNHSVQIDGNTLSGTYSNDFDNVSTCGALTQDWYINPTLADFANANHFNNGFGQFGLGDCFYINGSNGNTIVGQRCETYAGWGYDLGATQQTGNTQIWGGWEESNTLGDITCPSAIDTYYFGVQSNSTTGANTNCLNSGSSFGNLILPANSARVNQSMQFYGWNHAFTVNTSTPPNKTIFMFFNSETPPSGNTIPFAWNRTGTNNGTIQIGSLEYPVKLFSTLTWGTGLGAISQLIGPTDQAFSITSNTNKNMVINSAGTGTINLSTSNANIIFTPTGAGHVILFQGTPQLTPANFSTYSCNGSLQGQYYAINDSTTVAWGNTVVGGGGNSILGYCNGANIIVAAAASTNSSPTQTIAFGTAAMTTASISAISGSTVTCGATVTVAATGTLASDTIVTSPNNPESTPNTGLRLSAWPTTNNVNFAWCNPTASSQTPAGETLNWKVLR